MFVVIDWVVGFGCEDEIRGDEFCALVKELVEGMLGVGGGFAEEDRAGGVFDEVVCGAGYRFSVGFH